MFYGHANKAQVLLLLMMVLLQIWLRNRREASFGGAVGNAPTSVTRAQYNIW